MLCLQPREKQCLERVKTQNGRLKTAISQLEKAPTPSSTPSARLLSCLSCFQVQGEREHNMNYWDSVVLKGLHQWMDCRRKAPILQPFIGACDSQQQRDVVRRTRCRFRALSKGQLTREPLKPCVVGWPTHACLTMTAPSRPILDPKLQLATSDTARRAVPWQDLRISLCEEKRLCENFLERTPLDLE